MNADEERQTAALLGGLKAEPSTAARARAFAILAAEFHATAVRGSFGARRFAWVAAILMVLASAVTWQTLQPAARVATLESLGGTLVAHGTHWFSGNTRRYSGAQLSVGDSLTVSNDGGVLLRLSPDLTVRLAAGTRAKLAGNDAIELAAGEAFVDATPGAHAALRIVTPHGVVTHLGTQYLVRSGRDEIEVSVREGSVQLDTGRATVAAVAGEWLSHRDGEGGVLSGKLPVDDVRFEWIAALPTGFKLDGATLGEFLAWFRRETGLVPIYAAALDSGHLGQVRLKGTIQNLEPLEALSLVLATADLAWYRDGAKVIIEQHAR